MEPILTVSHLSFSYTKEKPVLVDVNFTVEQGQFVLLVGKNGSGKTALLRCIKGLQQQQTGTIVIDGTDLSGNPKKRNREIGLVFQDADSQIVGQTVARDIAFGLENLQIPQKEATERTNTIMRLFSMESLAHQRPRTLSGGEKRKLAIAGVLVMEPSILILDEPFANLDYPSVVQVLELLLLLKQQGHTIIMVSHEAEKVLAHIDTVLVLDEGAIKAAGPPTEVIPVLAVHGVRLPSLPLSEMTWLK